MNQEHRGMLEEILSMTTLAAGFLAYQAGAIGWAYVLWGKAAWDLVCAAKCWMKVALIKHNTRVAEDSQQKATYVAKPNA